MPYFTLQRFPILAYIVQRFPTPEFSQLERLEKKIEKTFPPIYRKFLLEYNGGVFDSELPSVKARVRHPTDFVKTFNVGILLGIGDEKVSEAFTLEWTWDCYEEILPPGIVPITTCGYGNA